MYAGRCSVSVDTAAPVEAVGVRTNRRDATGSATEHPQRAELVAQSMWRPERPLLRSHLMGGPTTAVGQNGVTVDASTAGAIPRLPILPKRVERTPRLAERFVTLPK